jgi:hypothetical protein
MMLLASIRHKLKINLLRELCIPMARNLVIAHRAKEDDRDPCGHAPGRNSVTLSQTCRHAHGQCIFGRTNCHTLQAPGALGRSNLDELVDWQDRGTGLCALGTVDTGVCRRKSFLRAGLELDPVAARKGGVTPGVLRISSRTDTDDSELLCNATGTVAVLSLAEYEKSRYGPMT